MSPPTSRPRLLLLLTATAVVVLSTAAFAREVDGRGQRALRRGSGLPAVAIIPRAPLGPMSPGGPAQVLSGTVSTPGHDGLRITAVRASIASVTKAIGAPPGSCDAGDYRLERATMAVRDQAGAHGGGGMWSGATIAFLDKPTNQDACKGATVALAYRAR